LRDWDRGLRGLGFGVLLATSQVPFGHAEVAYPNYAQYQARAYAEFARDCLMRRGPQPECAGMLEAAITFNPSDATSQFLLGQYQFLSGDRARALASFAQVQRLKPEQHDVLLWMGELYLQDGKPGPAREKFEQYARLRPERWEGLVGQASVKALQGETAAAIALLKQAISKGYHPTPDLLAAPEWGRLKTDPGLLKLLADSSAPATP